MFATHLFAGLPVPLELDADDDQAPAGALGTCFRPGAGGGASGTAAAGAIWPRAAARGPRAPASESPSVAARGLESYHRL